MDIRVNSKWTAAKLENERIAHRLTQQDVANAIGVSMQSVSNWENGRMPSVWNLMALSVLFDTPINELLMYGGAIG